MSTTNWWGNWRSNLPAHTGDLQPTDLIECTSIVGGVPVNTAITGQQIIDAAQGGGGTSNPTTISSVNGTGISGLTNTISANVFIPANTINTNNTIFISAFINRTTVSGSGSTTLRFYVNSTNSLTGATFLGSAGTMATSVRFQRFQRNIFFDGTNLNCFTTANSAANDLSLSSISLIPFNKTVDNYLIFAVQHSTSATDIAAWRRVIVQLYA